MPTLRGEKVVLREMRESDKVERMAIGRDPEFVRLNGGDTADLAPLTLAEVERWFGAWPQSHRWAIEHDGRLIGSIRFDDVDEHDRRASIAIGIFDQRYWGSGLGPDAIKLVLHHGFDELGLHRIELRVLEFNERAIRAYEKCGFRREGVERESALIDGVWHNDLRMSVLEDEYR